MEWQTIPPSKYHLTKRILQVTSGLSPTSIRTIPHAEIFNAPMIAGYSK